MTKPKFDPFKNLTLDQDEQDIENYLNTHDIKLAKPSQTQLNILKKAADNTFKLMKKDTKINIRVPHQTKLALQRKATKLGLRYQTLIGSILHQYANA